MGPDLKWIGCDVAVGTEKTLAVEAEVILVLESELHGDPVGQIVALWPW